MPGVIYADPSDNALVTFDWSDALVDAVTVSSVAHSVPSALTKGTETVVSPNSTVKVSGGVHGTTYMIEAQATLSNGEVLNRQAAYRVFNG